MKTIKWLLASLTIALVLIGCGDGQTTPPTPNTTPAANAGSDVTVTEGSTATTLTCIGTDADGDSLTYSWTLDGVKKATTTIYITPNDLTVGTHEYSCTVSDGQVSNSDQVVVKVQAAPEQNTKFTVQKSDLPELCNNEIVRIQIYTLHGILKKRFVDYGSFYVSNENLWTQRDLSITSSENNITVELPKTLDDIFAHATIYCYERNSLPDDANNAVSYDYKGNGFVKNETTMVTIFVKALFNPNGDDIPDELRGAYSPGRLAHGVSVSSNKELYVDWPDKASDSIQTLGFFYGGYDNFSAEYSEGVGVEYQNNDDYQNVSSVMYRFNQDGWNGYVSAPQAMAVSASEEERFKSYVKKMAPFVLLYDGTLLWGDLIENPEYSTTDQKFEFNLNAAPDYLK